MKVINDNFMLHNDYGKVLYEEYAKDMPIFDFHCHLEAKEIWENKKFSNITEIWLGGDHYKWRVMRAYGIPEEKITGNASDYEKFAEWSKIVPLLIGNPLYHWTHLELKTFFGIEKELNENTCKEIWERTNELLKTDDFRARKLIERSNVYAVCTTNDPVETLDYHKKIKEEDKFKTKVLPAMRPDKALNIEAEDYSEYINELSNVSEIEINSFEDLKIALSKRVKYFNDNGCAACDHAFNYIPFNRASNAELDNIFLKGLNGEKTNKEEEDKYKIELMIFLAKEYKKYDWVMELHIGALRNNNERMFNKLGPDTGYDSVNDYKYARELGQLLSAMDLTEELPRTILFSLNPKDNYVLSTLAGCFQGEEYGISKIQFGTAWWFLDHKDGMTKQIKDLAATGVLPNFIGMLTDSRSFLSYPRHDYFRRIICNILGEYVELGEYPWKKEFLGEIVKDISFNNAKKYIKIK
ncbi:glucuronate isomerase [Miniphocaeibacter halophilus]|uniref:Glucuronate isomerase n=1 Tax=Miniphocaeibacter halophilus TaxID=2931922 RepID=A0AC61MT57_9FIRM|nr:glucuronate isomerase [Miniphocaeibacter halophilus]QQK07785.1 glucuronate isomerase [Miniphocaeibacter halophilus]